jgi:glycosyltransferase involved in cell wall biosynthesis
VKRTLRVLHCPTLTGGNPPALARAERELGLESHCVAFQPSPFSYAADECLWSPGESRVRFEARRWQLLWRALRDFDVIHFNFGRSILPHAGNRASLEAQGVPGPIARLYGWVARRIELGDVALLRRAGKAVFVTFQGDDARQATLFDSRSDVDPRPELEPDYYTPESDAAKRRAIATWDRWADGIFTVNPDLLSLLPERAQFVPYAHVDMRAVQPSHPPPGRRDVPLLVHAPTHRGIKGTRFVLEAVERLRAEGVKLELRLIEGMSQREALAIYAQADLFIDQLLLGGYGGVAVELMALGRPVIAFIRPGELAAADPEMARDLPILNARPDDLQHVLRTWLVWRRSELVDVGRRARAWVERWHDPLRIAARLRDAYEGALSDGRRGFARARRRPAADRPPSSRGTEGA